MCHMAGSLLPRLAVVLPGRIAQVHVAGLRRRASRRAGSPTDQGATDNTDRTADNANCGTRTSPGRSTALSPFRLFLAASSQQN
jgi:hypothetical protein